MKKHYFFWWHVLFVSSTYCMEYSQLEQRQQQEPEDKRFNWDALPADIKKKIMYEYVGVEIPPEIAKNFKRDCTENSANDHDYAECYYDIDTIIVSGVTIRACNNCPDKPKIIWQKDIGKKIIAIASSTRGDRLAYSLRDGSIILCDMQTGETIATFDSMQDKMRLQDNTSKYSRINALAFNKDDSRLVAAGAGILIYDLASKKASLMENSILLKVRFDAINFPRENKDFIDVWVNRTPNYCTRWNSKTLTIVNEKIVATRPNIPFASRLSRSSDPSDKLSNAFIILSQVGSRGIIEKWRNYLIKQDDKQEPFDPLFAYLLLQDVDAAGVQGEMTQKQMLYYSIINKALHGALTKTRATPVDYA